MRIPRLLLALAMMASAVGAGGFPAAFADALDDQRCPKPTTFASVFSFGYGSDQMPQDDVKFAELLGKIKQGGFNVIHTSYTDNRLALCKQYGIQMMVDFLDTANHHVFTNLPGCQAVTAKVPNDPGIWGYNIWNDSFGSFGAGRYRDIRNVRTWDPTHPAFCGTYQTAGIDSIPNADVIGFYDYHWSRGIDIHFYDQLAYSTRATAWNAWYYSWMETTPAYNLGDNNYRKALWSANTSIACGQKGILWFLCTELMDPATLQWKTAAPDIIAVNQAIMPMQYELARIGNPQAIYTTLVTKTPDNKDLPDGAASRMPPGLENNAVPANFWIQPQNGEVLMGIYRDSQGHDEVYVANQNAFAVQNAAMQLQRRETASMFNRNDGTWTPLPLVARTVSFQLDMAWAELLRMTPLETYAWRLAQGGNWATDGNWREGWSPAGQGDTADFSQQVLTADATVTLDSNRTIGKLVFGDVAAAHNWTVSPGAGGVLTLQVAGGSPAITVNNQRATLSAVVTGTQGLTKNGPGMLALGAANTISGTTRIAAGTLQLGHPLALQNSTVDLSATDAGILDLNGHSATLGGLAGSRNLEIPAGGTLTIGSNGDSTTYSGVLTGSGTGLTKTGGGTLVLSGENAYTGPTLVDGGRLVLTQPSASSSFTVASGGALRLEGGTTDLGTRPFRALSGGTIEYQGAMVTGGWLRGPGTHQVLSGSTSIFRNVSTYNSTVLLQDGQADFTSFSNGGSLTNSALLSWNGGGNAASGRLTVKNTLNVQSWTNNGVITVNGGGAINNRLSHLVSGWGSRITINPGGTLNVDAAAQGATLDLQGALLVNNGTVHGVTNVLSGAVAKGSGEYGPVHVSDGGVFSPGNSPGTVTTGPCTWGAAGRYAVEISNAEGTAGVDWDLWHIHGTLAIAPDAGLDGQFVIEVVSLAGLASGPTEDFQDDRAYHWRIAQATDGIQGFDPLRIAVDASGFLNDTGGGRFYVSQTVNEVYLNFQPVPEPSTLALLGLGAIALFGLPPLRLKFCKSP